MAINGTRVLVGGLAAGVVQNIIAIVGYGLLLGPRVQAEAVAVAPALQGRGMSAPAIAANVTSSFVIGILLVWLYAAMRPRFGAGARTAAYAAIVVWICGLLFHLDWLVVGMMSASSFVLATLLALFQVLVAAYVGGMIYREDDVRSVAAPQSLAS